MPTTTTSTTLPPTMTTSEVAEALESIATSSTPRPLLEMWKRQRPTFQLHCQDNSVRTAQVDPPFWKMVADAWADNFLFRVYIRQEKKQALPASLPATPHTPTLLSSLEIAKTKTTMSNVDNAKTLLPTATATTPTSSSFPLPLSQLSPPSSPPCKTVKKPQYPQSKKTRTTPLQWRYVLAEDFAHRQTLEEEFKNIIAGCTHLGPHNARHVVPYPPLPTGLSAMRD
jgi:hypothetical protein